MKYVVLCCAFLLAVSATAQVPGPSVKFGVHGNLISSDLTAKLQKFAGVTPGTSTTEVALKEVYGLGLGGGIHLDIDLGILSFRVSGDYITMSPDKDKFKTVVQPLVPAGQTATVDGGRIDVIQGTANAKLVILPLPIVKPYLTGGGGFAKASSSEVTLAIGTASIKFEPVKGQTVGTANAGAGVDISLGGLALFGEIKLNWLWLEEGTLSYLPIATVGLTF